MSIEIAVRYWILPVIAAVVQCILKRKEMLQVFQEHPTRIIGVTIG